MGVCRHWEQKEDIFPFQQLFTEWKSDYFQPRYSQKREKTPQYRVLGVGEGRLLEGGVYWGFYGILHVSFVVYEELYATRMFETMSIQTDEDEHSIEMHLPYIAKVMER